MVLSAMPRPLSSAMSDNPILLYVDNRWVYFKFRETALRQILLEAQLPQPSTTITMSSNGQSFLLDPEKYAGPTRYSHARVVPPATHHTIYISGIAAVSPDGTYDGVMEYPDSTYAIDVGVQTAAVLRRIESIIKGASNGNANLYNIVDATVYLTDMKMQYAAMNHEWNKIWSDRASAPSRATIGVRELPDPRFAVEIKATAIF